MTWSMNASGHTSDPEDEKELHARLTEIFSDGKYGASSSNFGGTHISGAVHPTAGESAHSD